MRHNSVHVTARLTVLEGGKGKRPAKPARLWECVVCEADTGNATTTAIKVRRMPHVKGGKLTGGHDAWVCAACLARGKITPVQ